jgi:hypothetical protein
MRRDVEKRLYRIQNHRRDYFTGICRDERQVVLGLLCPHVVAYFFDSDGRFVGHERQLWNHPAPRMRLPPELSHIPTIMPAGAGPYKIHDPEFQAALAVHLEQWQKSLRYSAAPIPILKFFDAPSRIGIRLIPDCLKATARNLSGMSAHERREVEREREEWLARGRFVWWWGKDYWMNSDGEVEST